MSLKTGEHAGLTSAPQVEALLRDKFTGVPDDWIPSIAQQVVQEAASPAGEGGAAARAASGAAAAQQGEAAAKQHDARVLAAAQGMHARCSVVP
jgi:hypothetical protein